ncbi:MAG TPA: DUF368 domain-containing protein [Lachnoclostridium phytofermentans]|uniref:DUF368 domain-containing protein n=1 Tax=Lachnoclostridium phytofermentans TaxID=66219 RepID=A0A3D2X1Q4_9FIRM|nr:DUF368 domain-containing protein [Lachnoclostridium sp.]HCL01079.1 DUF368 domain-containing protein [Lachnoclostridium phytofermentans]
MENQKQESGQENETRFVKSVVRDGGKGVIVGGSMLVPGVSGGTMAMLLGIYDSLITSVSNFFQHPKKALKVLIPFVLGALLGMVVIAKPILALIEKYPMPTLYFFLGAVAGGIPFIIKKADVSKLSFSTVFYLLFGIALVVGIARLPENLFTVSLNVGLREILLLIAAGIFVAVALILPGISVSYMLLVMGMYQNTMDSISRVYLPYLIPLGIGGILGILLTTRLLEKAMNKYPRPTYLIILGFMIGSVAEIFPGVPNGLEWIWCIPCAVVGFIVMHALGKE